MLGSGYKEILFKAQLFTSGSMKGALTGKAYAKALFFFKAVCKAMKRLLMGRFCGEESSRISESAILFNLLKSCSRENLDAVLEESSC